METNNMATAQSLIDLKQSLLKLRASITDDYNSRISEIDDALRHLHTDLVQKCDHKWIREPYPYAPLMCVKCHCEKP